MTLWPPPEIVTYHLDKLCALAGSTEYCCLLCKLPDQRQAAMSPKHPDVTLVPPHHPASSLPLDNKHHPILSLSLSLPVLSCSGSPCIVFLPLLSSAGRAVSTTRSHQSSFLSHRLLLGNSSGPLDRPPESSSLRYLCYGTHAFYQVAPSSLSTLTRLIADPRPLFAFRVRLEDPPPKPGSTSPPISAGRGLACQQTNLPTTGRSLQL